MSENFTRCSGYIGSSWYFSFIFNVYKSGMNFAALASLQQKGRAMGKKTRNGLGAATKQSLLTATGTAAMLLLSQSAHAANVVATIIGAYDASCGSHCSGVMPAGISNYATNGGTTGDTPSLFILNPNGSSFTGVTLTLTGYQDQAGGGTGATLQNPGPGPALTQTLTLPSIAPHTVYQLVWNGAGDFGGSNSIPGGSIGAPSGSGLDLFAFDYDDNGSGDTNAAGTGATDSLGNSCGSGSGSSTSLCGYVGNFDVKFAALLNGNSISANFSPDNTQGGGNVAGTFVGWEGLDPDGLSETKYDVHSTNFPGTLANIVTGTKGTQTSVPEPGTLALLGAGLGALSFARRRRKAT